MDFVFRFTYAYTMTKKWYEYKNVFWNNVDTSVERLSRVLFNVDRDVFRKTRFQLFF